MPTFSHRPPFSARSVQSNRANYSPRFFCHTCQLFIQGRGADTFEIIAHHRCMRPVVSVIILSSFIIGVQMALFRMMATIALVLNIPSLLIPIVGDGHRTQMDVDSIKPVKPQAIQKLAVLPITPLITPANLLYNSDSLKTRTSLLQTLSDVAVLGGIRVSSMIHSIISTRHAVPIDGATQAGVVTGNGPGYGAWCAAR